MSSRSKSTLFLIEQLIVVAVFAICATACIRILTNAYFYAVDARDTSNALHAAESGAESFKAVSGDFRKAAELLGGTVGIVDGADALIVYFDESWQAGGESGAAFVLRLVDGRQAAQLFSGSLSVERVTGEELVSFPVAVRR